MTKSTVFGIKKTSIKIQIREFNPSCHKGEYRISYWNGYYIRIRGVKYPKITEVFFKISDDDISIELLSCKKNWRHIESDACGEVMGFGFFQFFIYIYIFIYIN